MRKSIATLCLLLAAPVHAQIQSRPTDPPLVTAVNESWYQLREPVQFAGDVYYPAGAAVFFDGNTMVRTGHYNGVPLYADTTIEPYSVVLVPVARGLMQPYERRRRGDVVGTTGSRAPSFPVGTSAQVTTIPQSATAPTAPPLPVGSIPAYTPESNVVGTTGRVEIITPRPVGTSGQAVSRRTVAPPFSTLRRPEGNDGVWISYAGEKWVSAGPAIHVDADFTQAGQYAGFPVLTRAGRQDVIYLPTREGLAAPYKRKQ